MDAVERFAKEKVGIKVPPYAFDRAVRHLDRLEALALIRAAYKEDDGGYASLTHAKEIYEIIIK